eukprot:Gb_01900 [translate_table: standard]
MPELQLGVIPRFGGKFWHLHSSGGKYVWMLWRRVLYQDALRKKEEKGIIELIFSDTAKGLVHFFFSHRATSKVPGVIDLGLEPKQITKQQSLVEVMTLAYRAPEILLGDTRQLGTPNEHVWPSVTSMKNWHEYPQWKPKDWSLILDNLYPKCIDLLSVPVQMSYWKGKVLPRIKKCFGKGLKKQEVEAAKSFDKSKESIKNEIQEKKGELQPHVVKIYNDSKPESKDDYAAMDDDYLANL